MQLKALLSGLGAHELRGSTDVQVTAIHYHSAEVTPSSLFVAVPGYRTDGRGHIAEALRRGAAVLVFEGSFIDNSRATQVRVSGARLALAHLSAAFYDHPTKSLYLSGVTGTNGKTTLTYLLESLWQTVGRKTAIVGTINRRVGSTITPAGQTTPESRDLQKFFAEALAQGVHSVAIEASSHALIQGRVEGCHFDSCVFTNLTQDHLDFHGTMEEYYRAKEKLFLDYFVRSEKKEKAAIVGTDSAYGKKLADSLKRKKMELATYGLKRGNDVFPKKISMTLQGIEAELSCRGKIVPIRSALLGRFNLVNIEGALLVGLHSGLSETDVIEGIKRCRVIPGRLERVDDRSGRLIFVDYAHTPDALKNVLETLRELSPPRIVTVFGCGGDRDPGKRPLMGREVALHSDFCIVTSDNPRTEDPEKIISQIIPGIEEGGMKRNAVSKGFFVEPDRRKAIAKGLERTRPGDLLLITGKGHEDYQIIGTQRNPFSDKEVVRELVGTDSPLP